MPFNRSAYPQNWAELRRRVLERAGNRCEQCAAMNGEPHPVTGSKVVLTTAHLFANDLETQDIGRLRALCQRCHNALDAPMRQAHARVTRAARARQGQLPLPFWERPKKARVARSRRRHKR